MSGILSGKHAGFLSEEIFTEDVNIEAVDGDLLAEELEKAQEDLFIEQEKFNTAIEAECETNEIVDEIEAALESGSTDVVHAKLLVNKLIKNNSIFYGNSKPLVSALESDRGSDARSILQAGLEDGKGMVNAIKEFIAKVWQKIKDAFAWVWKKMKDFWAWLTGASKKVEEKKEETVVAAAGVNAAATKSKEIIAIAQTTSYKAGSGSEVNSKRAAEAVKKYKERMDKAASSSKAKGESGLTVKGGKFDGRDLGSLSFSEMSEMLEEGNAANTETVNDIVIADVITEEVAKTTGLSEEKVASYISPAMMKQMTVFAFDPKISDEIAIVVNNNIRKDELIKTYLIKALFFQAASTNDYADGFRYMASSIFDDYNQYREKTAIGEKAFYHYMGNIKTSLTGICADITLVGLIKDGIKTEALSRYIKNVSDCTECFIDAIKQIDEVLNKGHWEKYALKEVAKHTGSMPLVFTSVMVDNQKITAHYFNIFEKKNAVFTDIDYHELLRLKFIASDIKHISEAKIGHSVDSKPYDGIKKLEKELDFLVKYSDGVLKDMAINEAKYKNDKNWMKTQGNLVKIISNVSYLNPAYIMGVVKNNNEMIMRIVNTIDLPGAIAQASKEFDSSKFKFDKK